jgi:adenylosuccinate synthase
MTVDLLLGLQWGDEGKGKIVDVLTSKYDIIARFQGGPNAGHTLEFDGIKHVLRTIPSGIFHSNNINIIGNGVVIDPVVFKSEVDGLAKINLDFKSKMIISSKAQFFPNRQIRFVKFASLAKLTMFKAVSNKFAKC